MVTDDVFVGLDWINGDDEDDVCRADEMAERDMEEWWMCAGDEGETYESDGAGDWLSGVHGEDLIGGADFGGRFLIGEL